MRVSAPSSVANEINYDGGSICLSNTAAELNHAISLALRPWLCLELGHFRTQRSGGLNIGQDFTICLTR
jgi:hypothetical protein